MKTTKKILSLLLVFALLTVVLSSCDVVKSADKIISDAETALKEKNYTVDMVIQYQSDDERMAEAIADFTSPTILTEVDGESFRISMTFDKDGVENGVTYTYVDGVLYTEIDELGETTTRSETVTTADKKELTETLGQGASISTEDFSSVDKKSFNGITLITCTEIKDEPLIALVESLEGQLTSLDAHVAIKDVNLVIQLTDGLYDKTLLTCEYVITTSTDVYTLTMTYAAKFTYGDVEEIAAP